MSCRNNPPNQPVPPQQFFQGAAPDPNAAGFLPDKTSLPAVYEQSPSVTQFNRWTWDVVTQKWFQTVQP